MLLRPLKTRLATMLVIVGVIFVGAPSISLAASTHLSPVSLSVSISGNIVTATTKIASSPGLTASSAGVCARSSRGSRRDFTLASNLWLPSAGVTVTSAQPLPAGAYTYWSCAKIGGRWVAVSAKRTFVVSSAPAAPVDVPMPRGNLPHFRQIFTDDFTTSLSAGSFPGAYSSKWMSYNGFADSHDKGTFNQKIISMHDGLMDLHVQVANGRVQGAAPIPLIKNGKWGGQTYGKYTVRFKADTMRGVSAAWLLWPDSNRWGDGEIDFPEGAFNGPFWAFTHCINDPSVNCDYLNTQSTYQGWHTASIEWTPASIKFVLDGAVLLTSTSAIPRVPMHWVLQTESNADTATSGGHVYIDWVSIYQYVP